MPFTLLPHALLVFHHRVRIINSASQTSQYSWMEINGGLILQQNLSPLNNVDSLKMPAPSIMWTLWLRLTVSSVQDYHWKTFKNQHRGPYIFSHKFRSFEYLVGYWWAQRAQYQFISIEIWDVHTWQCTSRSKVIPKFSVRVSTHFSHS